MARSSCPPLRRTERPGTPKPKSKHVCKPGSPLPRAPTNRPPALAPTSTPSGLRLLHTPRQAERATPNNPETEGIHTHPRSRGHRRRKLPASPRHRLRSLPARRLGDRRASPRGAGRPGISELGKQPFGAGPGLPFSLPHPRTPPAPQLHLLDRVE